jgi:hypothetical protein
VRMDLQKMKIKNWKRSVLDRNLWRTIGLSGPKLAKSCSVYQEEEEVLWNVKYSCTRLVFDS